MQNPLIQKILMEKPLMQKPILELCNVSTYLGNNYIHKDVNLKIEQGLIYSIVGGSGAGKSVLIKTILGLIPIYCGKILFQGKDMDINFFRSKCGIQFQNGALMSALTVLENVMLPLLYKAELNQKISTELAAYKLNLVGLDSIHFNKKPSELSGGMIKRVALARALALDPMILFLDEPTSGLDPISAKEYEVLIQKLHNNLNITILMITHDILRVRHMSDKVVIVHDKKLYTGTFEEILADNKLKKYVSE